MKSLFLFLLLSAMTFGQSNLYWKQHEVPGKGANIFWISDSSYLCFNYGDKVYITHDNFKTFTKILDINCGVSDFLAKENFLFLNAGGRLLRLNLGNLEFFETTVHDPRKILDCEENGILVQNSQGRIFKTIDMGTTFEEVVFRDLLRFWSYAGNGNLFFYHDESNVYKTDISFSDSSLVYQPEGLFNYIGGLYSAGEDSILVEYGKKYHRSIDGGLNWEIIESSDYSEMHLLPYLDGIIHLRRDGLWRTFDFGFTWEQIFYCGAIVTYGDLNICGNKIFIYYDQEWDYNFYYDPAIEAPLYNNYFPLAMGNKWMYVNKGWLFWDVPLFYLEVTDTLTIFDELYFWLTPFDNWYRYTNNSLVVNTSGIDSTVIDFNVNPGNLVSDYLFDYQKTMMEDVIELGDQEVYVKGPYSSVYGHPNTNFYSPDLGMVLRYQAKGSWTGISSGYTKLAQASIKTINGEVNYNFASPPVINIDSNLSVNGDFANFNINIYHTYSGYDHGEFYYHIQDAVLDYFYVLGDSTTVMEHVVGVANEPGHFYRFSFPLRNDLLSDGYELKCAIIVTDKSMFPQTTRWPAEGYNTVGWNSIIVEQKEVNEYFYSLNNNYPNPFNPSTTITYSLAEPSFVILDVFNIQGEKVSSLVSKQQAAGEYNVKFDGSDLASGVYIAKLRATSGGNENFTKSVKMILLK